MTQDERKGLILCLKIEFSDGLGGGGEDMCTVLEELKMQGIELGREEGRIYGAISVYRDFKLSEEEISKLLQEKSGLTPREAEEYLEKV